MKSRPLLLPLVASVLVACNPPAATPPPTTQPSPSAEASLPPGHPAVGAGAADAPAALPPGHPPTGGGALPPGHAPVAQGPSGPPVSGRVTVSGPLQARAAGARALYVIARKAGTRDIVAVKKIDQPTFPAAFELSGGDAMVPGTPFAGPFDLTVRLSKSGDAIPAAGDLEGSSKGVAAGAKDVTVALDTVRQ